MWIDYQLHIYFIYIYIFLFSRSLTQLLLRTRTFIPLALIYFCLQCNKNGDRPEITITNKKKNKNKKTKQKKKQTQKIEEGERRVRPGRTAAVCCPSLTVAAERTQSAWCSDIKEEAAEAPSPWSCALWAGGSPAPHLKAWYPRSPWLRSRRSLGALPRRKRSSLHASAWTEAAPGQTGCGLRALLLETDAPLRTS